MAEAARAAPGSNRHQQQQPRQSPRRPSGGRPPPVFIPGLPIRSDFSKPSSTTQPHHHMSMPPPTQTMSSSRRQPSSNHSSMSSRPSPALSASSGDRSLIESTNKLNIGRPTTSRQASATLDWDERIKTPKEQFISQVDVRDEVEVQFGNLLDSLQVPASVREKFVTVSPSVKSSILSSSMTSNPTILASLGLPLPPTSNAPPNLRKRLSTPLLRKHKSSSSLDSPGRHPQEGKTYSVEGDAFVIVKSPTFAPNPQMGPPAVPIRGQSMDTSRAPIARQSTPARPLSSIFSPSSSSNGGQSVGRNAGKGLGISMGGGPEGMVNWLNSGKGTDLKMDVGQCKKLRMLLRHEDTQWVASFIEMGGYKLVLVRLQDLLDVEWREEQHDDQMLYELLRCIKALSTSEIGKSALRAHFPRPFPALSTLLFSEKKPGDLASRQIIVELWLFLFDLFPLLPVPQPRQRTSIRFDEPPKVDVTTLIRSLLVPESTDPVKDHHEFITQSHRPRVFKAWVGELSDICRDYFWVMCHGSNTLWALHEVDESLVEKPVAPGGATGGVEYEAMNYVTIHFKLLNAFSSRLAIESKEKATELHTELMASGMDRILVTLRKASTTYYPTLHLELARYVALLHRASPTGKLPYLIGKLVGGPPEELRKREMRLSYLPELSGAGRRGAWDAQA
ncbi:hypothetical protein P7C73_g1130, partial [Tremellales sp. Uapishka_1]